MLGYYYTERDKSIGPVQRRKINKSKLFFIKVLINQKILTFGKKLFLTILIRKP